MTPEAFSREPRTTACRRRADPRGWGWPFAGRLAKQQRLLALQGAALTPGRDGRARRAPPATRP
jgi:hypothetical protein